MTSRLCFALFLGLTVAAVLVGQEQPFTIRVNVAAVTVEAVVHEPGGRVVTDLKATDFEIYEDGQLQEIAYFASSETPRSILLLFDISGSTDSQRPFMVRAFNVFLALLRPQDRVALASFAGNFQMLMNWRNVGGKAQDVQIPSPQFYSNVYSSIEDAAESMKNERARKGIIVMTDGRDTDMFDRAMNSRKIVDIDADRGFQRVVQNVGKHNIPIYFIALNTDRNPAITPMDREYTSIAGRMGQASAEAYVAAVRMRMERLARITGGRILYPRSLQEVAPLYEAIGRELGLSYSLGYTPMNRGPDQKARRIEVRVRREGAKVTQSRDSYTPQ